MEHQAHFLSPGEQGTAFLARCWLCGNPLNRPFTYHLSKANTLVLELIEHWEISSMYAIYMVFNSVNYYTLEGINYA